MRRPGGHAPSSRRSLPVGTAVTLTSDGRDDRDRYGRLLRYVDAGATDTGREMIGGGLAIARYDSRDGYGRHPREVDYVALDVATPDRGCGAAVGAEPAVRLRQLRRRAGRRPGADPGRRARAGTPSSTPTATASAASDVPGPLTHLDRYAAESSSVRDADECRTRRWVAAPAGEPERGRSRRTHGRGPRRRTTGRTRSSCSRPAASATHSRSCGPAERLRDPSASRARRLSTSTGGPSAGRRTGRRAPGRCASSSATHSQAWSLVGGRRRAACPPARASVVGEQHAPPRAGDVRLQQDRRRRRRRRAARRSAASMASRSSTTVTGSMAPCVGRATAVRGRPPTAARPAARSAVVGRDAPDLGGGRPVVGRPVGREDDARRDRESGGTGGGEVGGLATHPRHVERRWVVQRDDGCGGAHGADGAARPCGRLAAGMRGRTGDHRGVGGGRGVVASWFVSGRDLDPRRPPTRLPRSSCPAEPGRVAPAQPSWTPRATTSTTCSTTCSAAGRRRRRSRSTPCCCSAAPPRHRRADVARRRRGCWWPGSSCSASGRSCRCARSGGGRSGVGVPPGCARSSATASRCAPTTRRSAALRRRVRPLRRWPRPGSSRGAGCRWSRSPTARVMEVATPLDGRGPASAAEVALRGRPGDGAHGARRRGRRRRRSATAQPTPRSEMRPLEARAEVERLARRLGRDTEADVLAYACPRRGHGTTASAGAKPPVARRPESVRRSAPSARWRPSSPSRWRRSSPCGRPGVSSSPELVPGLAHPVRTARRGHRAGPSPVIAGRLVVTAIGAAVDEPSGAPRAAACAPLATSSAGRYVRSAGASP